MSNFTPTPLTGEFTSSIVLDRLLKKRGIERSTISMSCKIKLASDIKSVAEGAMFFNPDKIFQHNVSSAICEFADANFMLIQNQSADENIFWMTCYGDIEWVKALKSKHEYLTEDKTIITWFYKNSGALSSVDFEIDAPPPLHEEFYPYIPGGPTAYFENYFKSSASILVLIGEPGTGKTSLIRDTIYKRKLHAAVTFDEEVMAEESYFVNYASSDDHDIMIVEDADLLLSSRQSDQNKLMNKLLNISDGLIKLDRKKIIFSTNLSNVNKIDPALIRPGRCFDILRFRTLTAPEAAVAAAKVNVELQPNKKEYTLAEIFHASRKKEETDCFRLLKTA